MSIIMCGFNGFQQINSILSTRNSDTFAIVIPSAIESNFPSGTDKVKHCTIEDPVLHKSRKRDIKSIVISWSSVYVLYEDGCVSVHGGTCQFSRSAEIIMNVKHLCCGWNNLFYVNKEGHCYMYEEIVSKNSASTQKQNNETVDNFANNTDFESHKRKKFCGRNKDLWFQKPDEEDCAILSCDNNNRLESSRNNLNQLQNGTLSESIKDLKGCNKDVVPDDKSESARKIKFEFMEATDSTVVAVDNSGNLHCIEKLGLHGVTQLTDNLFQSLPVSKVRNISCGKQFVLFTTEQGSVYSYGAGNHGELGHGTLESLSQPKLVEFLDGVVITQVSAGGWHSVARGRCGEIYVWGWNERGQLGLPSRGVLEEYGKCGKKYENFIGCVGSENDHFVNIQSVPQLLDIQLSRFMPFSLSRDSCKKCNDDINSVSDDAIISNATYDDNESLKTSCYDVIKSQTSYESIVNPGTPYDDDNIKSKTSCDNAIKRETSNYNNVTPTTYESVRLESSCDTIRSATSCNNIISEISSDNMVDINKVACGSRHTVVLTEDGRVLAWGWNEYGQLGLGDRLSRDHPTLVSFISNTHSTVSDVYAGYWNSAFIVHSN